MKPLEQAIRVGIMGFGKTGKSVTSVLMESKETSVQWVARRTIPKDKSVQTVLGIESDEPGEIHSIREISCADLLDRSPVDVIVDFSTDVGIDYYGEEAAMRNVTILSAISNYSSHQLDLLKLLAKKTRVIYSPNITIGINFLILASMVLRKIAPFVDVEVIEEHFKTKPEVSGTAKVIARNLEIDESAIKTIRAGGIIGVHEVLFGFPFQTLRIKHESIMREAFGNGALFVIRNMPSASRGFFSMQDLMLPYFNVAAKEPFDQQS